MTGEARHIGSPELKAQKLGSPSSGMAATISLSGGEMPWTGSDRCNRGSSRVRMWRMRRRWLGDGENYFTDLLHISDLGAIKITCLTRAVIGRRWISRRYQAMTRCWASRDTSI